MTLDKSMTCVVDGCGAAAGHILQARAIFNPLGSTVLALNAPVCDGHFGTFIGWRTIQMRVGERDIRVGDRVTRPAFMDDGAWAREGDACLPRSPLRRGTVAAVAPGGYIVVWDDGSRGGLYLRHGLDPEGGDQEAAR